MADKHLSILCAKHQMELSLNPLFTRRIVYRMNDALRRLEKHLLVAEGGI